MMLYMYLHPRVYRAVRMARHAHSLVKGLDMSLKEHLHEYVVIKGSGLGRTIQTVQVR